MSPSPQQVDDLRTTLCELAAQADESQLSEFSDLQLFAPTDETSSTPDFYHGNTTTTSSGSDSSGSSQHSFSSPVGFLQAAFPHIPTKTLTAAFANAEKDEGNVDMWGVIAGILSEESIRELEERGLDGLNEDDELASALHDEITWEIVASKKKSGVSAQAGKRKNTRGNKITIVDIRQQQHLPAKNESRVSAPDPWTQLSSLSAYLATLVPSHPPSFFQSYFHSPCYATPYAAICAALRDTCKARSISEEHTPIFLDLSEILLQDYDLLDSEQRDRFVSDVELSVRATEGRGDDAFDLVKLLRDLDSDSGSGHLEMGVYHLLPQSPTKGAMRNGATLPMGPPPIQPPPPPAKVKLKPPPLSQKRKPSPFQWQAIPERKVVDYGPQQLAQHIPAYNRDVNGMKVRGSGNGFGKGRKGDVGELGESQRKMTESMRKRAEALQEASRMWQRGNSKTRGGEVAFYYAEKVGHFSVPCVFWLINVRRESSKNSPGWKPSTSPGQGSKPQGTDFWHYPTTLGFYSYSFDRLASHDHDVIDLHGTTVAEAIVIVKETLEVQGSSAGMFDFS